MADTVKVPGIKEPLPKWAVFGGVGAVAIAVWFYYRNRGPQTAAVDTGQAAADTTGGDSGYESSTGNQPNTQPYQTPGGPPFATNSAWASWVIQEIQASNPNVNAGALTDAIGLYLAGQPLTAAQRTLVFDAKAVGNDPPVAGPGGYPPKLRSDGSKGPESHKPGKVTGLRETAVTAGSASVAWKAVRYATSYRVRAWDVTAGKPGVTMVHDRTVKGTSDSLTGLKRHTKYGWHVQAADAAGTGPWSGDAHFTTK